MERPNCEGDAIAGIVIVLINIIGGLLLVSCKKHGIGTALHVYDFNRWRWFSNADSILLISTAVGIVVTRSTSESHLDGLTHEMFARPQIFNYCALAL